MRVAAAASKYVLDFCLPRRILQMENADAGVSAVRRGIVSRISRYDGVVPSHFHSPSLDPSGASVEPTPLSSRASISSRSPDRSLELCHISLFLLAALRAEMLPSLLRGLRFSRRRATENGGKQRKRSRESRSLNLDSDVNPDIMHRVLRNRGQRSRGLCRGIGKVLLHIGE